MKAVQLSLALYLSLQQLYQLDPFRGSPAWANHVRAREYLPGFSRRSLRCCLISSEDSIDALSLKRALSRDWQGAALTRAAP
jgi:hypothetical protein